MKLKYVKGDLLQMALDGQFDVIGHGCNCFVNMGKGIAKGIKQKFPEAYRADRQTEKGDKSKLGTITCAEQHGIIVVNCYSQYGYGRMFGGGPPVDYEAIRNCMKEIKERFSGKRIGLPLIGCGLAGGDWDIVSEIIATELADENVTIVRFDK